MATAMPRSHTGPQRARLSLADAPDAISPPRRIERGSGFAVQLGPWRPMVMEPPGQFQCGGAASAYDATPQERFRPTQQVAHNLHGVHGSSTSARAPFRVSEG